MSWTASQLVVFTECWQMNEDVYCHWSDFPQCPSRCHSVKTTCHFSMRSVLADQSWSMTNRKMLSICAQTCFNIVWSNVSWSAAWDLWFLFFLFYEPPCLKMLILKLAQRWIKIFILNIFFLKLEENVQVQFATYTHFLDWYPLKRRVILLKTIANYSKKISFDILEFFFAALTERNIAGNLLSMSTEGLHIRWESDIKIARLAE